MATAITASNVDTIQDPKVQDRLDRNILIGALCAGSIILVIPGVVILAQAILEMRRKEREGYIFRPYAVTVVAVVTIVDVAVNYLIWGLNLLPTHDSPVVQSLFGAFGRQFDGAYYLGYNQSALGGTPVAGEFTWALAGIVMLFPMRLVAAWAFMKMKRWGYQFFVVTTWIYLFWWIGYFANLGLGSDFRFGDTRFGLIGWWLANMAWFYPFLLLPYLHTVKRSLWVDDSRSSEPNRASPR